MKIIKSLFWASCLFFFTLVVIEVFIGNKDFLHKKVNTDTILVESQDNDISLVVFSNYLFKSLKRK